MSNNLMLNLLYFCMAIAFYFNLLLVSIPSTRCCYGCWLTVAPAWLKMHNITIASPDFMLHSIESELNHILIVDCDWRSVGDIRQCDNLLLQVWRILSVNSVNIDQTQIPNMNFHCKHKIVIVDFFVYLVWQKLLHQPLN
jgi:hypothetical protein